jgi:hypothetical protein
LKNGDHFLVDSHSPWTTTGRPFKRNIAEDKNLFAYPIGFQAGDGLTHRLHLGSLDGHQPRRARRGVGQGRERYGCQIVAPMKRSASFASL